MFQRTCQRPESALERSVLAIRRRGAPCHPGIGTASVHSAFLAEQVPPAGKVLDGWNVHSTLGMSRPFDVSLGPLLGSRPARAASPGLASTSGLSRRCGWRAWADAGDAAARAV
jgi:hypothetical protein